MKTNIFKIKYLFIAGLLFLLLTPAIIFSQDSLTVDDYKTIFYFKTFKQSDDSRLLEVEFLARNKKNKKDKIAVIKAPIKFYNIGEDQEVLLGNADTDMEGKANFTLEADHEYILDEDGYTTLAARFEGSDDLDEEEEELIFKDVNLNLELGFEDSIKMIYVTAYTLDSLGEEIPVEELDIIVGVEGMLSRMPLDEGTLEEGEYEFELEEDLPGDQNGEIIFYAYIDDHEDFVNVIKTKKEKWGVSKPEQQQLNYLLWTKAAPVWMYIVLTILLVGVWINFAYSLRNLFKIKKMGKH